MKQADQDPFGQPDGAMDDEGGLVQLDKRFGGIARDPRDARIRVIVGPLGSGKSLYLRRMQASRVADASTYAPEIQRNDDLSTEQVVKYQTMMSKGISSTEHWTLLWRRAIFRSAWSYLRTVEFFTNNIDPKSKLARRGLDAMADLIGAPPTDRRVSSQVSQIILFHQGRREISKYLNDERWEDVENYICTIMASSPPLFLHVDDIDKNYAWAPSYWTLCQRGLFDAVMHLARHNVLRTKLHVVVALRDVTLATVTQGEHGPRYFEDTHINHLLWSQDSARSFLRTKTERLSRYDNFSHVKSVASWVGMPSVTNDRPTGDVEDVESYLLRHTRLVPRDIVILGNSLCKALNSRVPLDEARLKKVVSEVSRLIVWSQLSVCATQLISESPGDQDFASANGGSSPLDEPLVSGSVTILLEAIREVGSDRFGKGKAATLDERAHDAFQSTSKLTDILWQHRLLSWVDRSETLHFFQPQEYFGRHRLPRDSSVRAYQWHCMVHDIVPSLKVLAPVSAFPG
ncbi:P-loop ATPase, Sll1717 family [Tersicoccus phoenicis]|uniref:P-loop ATPase, Sll1717 family n=1 Tax=Tersicoccus phoenicis TaxID=554083 RepID=UPI00117E0574|nr:hypothetical protein [Tersicoccus phoenicis]